MSYLKLFRMSDMKKNHENENMTSKYIKKTREIDLMKIKNS